MARRAEPTQHIDNITAVVRVTRRERYVSCYLDEESPFAGLMLDEIRAMERQVRMSKRMAAVWEAHLVGAGPTRIAQALGVDESTVRQFIRQAEVRVSGIEHKGWYTAAVEACGQAAVRNYLEDVLEQEQALRRLERLRRLAQRTRKQSHPVPIHEGEQSHNVRPGGAAGPSAHESDHTALGRGLHPSVAGPQSG